MIQWPSTRTVVRVLGIALAVLLAAGLAARIYGKRRLAAAETRLAAALAPYSAASLTSPAVPANENAAIVLRAGAQALLLPRPDAALAGTLALRAAPEWSAEERGELDRIVAANAPGLELLERGSKMPRSSFELTRERDGSLDFGNLPLLALVNAARLEMAVALRALDAGDQAKFLASAAVVAKIGESLGAEAPLIAKLIGIAGERMFLGLARRAVADPSATPATLRALGELIGTSDLRLEWKRCLAAEHGLWQAAVERNEAGALDRRDDEPTVFRRVTGYVFGPWAAARATEALSAIVDAPDTPYAEAKASLPAPFVQLSRSWLDAVAGPVVPNLLNSSGRLQATLSQRRMARVALALRLHASASGALPASLEAIPEASAADPFTGGNLSYELRPDGSAVLELSGADTLYNEMAHVSNSCPFSWEILPGHPGR